MARRRQPRQLTQGQQVALLVVLAVLLVAWLLQRPWERPGGEHPAVAPGDYLFCFWNAENFFDDLDDDRNDIDDEYDDWFAQNPADLRLKLDKLTEALLRLNGGNGPDILALAEVEGVRAAELLKDSLNARLAADRPGAGPYKHVLMKEVKSGRHIATAILTRLPVVAARTRQYDKRLRILEGRVTANGKELIVVAAHWTSRLGDGGESGRANYADQIYGEYKAMYLANPAVDVLVCGDFNDTPQDVSVTDHLHGSRDADLVRAGGRGPLLYNLMAGKDPRAYGSHYYSRGKGEPWFIFDQILVSPGMLDGEGWSCKPDSVQTIRSLARPGDSLGRPWRFGGRTDDPTARGYSDHFPVTVTLSVAGANAAGDPAPPPDGE